MRKLLDYLPFHFLLCIIFGIIIQFYGKIWNSNFSYLNAFILPILTVLYFLKKTNLRKLFSIITLLFFMLIGIFATFISNPKNYSNFYYKHISNSSSATLVITKKLKPTKYYHKFIVQVAQIDSQKTIGSVLLNLKKDSTFFPLKIDDRVFITSEFKNITPSLNPYQFNYKNYLAKQHIHHQVFISKNDYKFLDRRKTSINGVAEKFRDKIQSSLKKQHFKPDEFSVINALLLGQRQNISKTLSESYIKAGAIHILAISGLHIGVIFLIFSYLFKPLEALKHWLLYKNNFNSSLIMGICFYCWVICFCS